MVLILYKMDIDLMCRCTVALAVFVRMRQEVLQHFSPRHSVFYTQKYIHASFPPQLPTANPITHVDIHRYARPSLRHQHLLSRLLQYLSLHWEVGKWGISISRSWELGSCFRFKKLENGRFHIGNLGMGTGAFLF